MKMYSTRFCLAAIVTSIALIAQAADVPSEVERGRQLFMSTGCYQCHGTVGQGGRVTGPALLPTLWPLAAFVAQLRQPTDAMPPYTAKVMSDNDIAAIHAYLASLPASPDASTITLLHDAAKP